MAKILFFSPNSAVLSFADPEALVAEALREEGNEIIYITCGKAFSDYCISMSANGLTYESSIEQKKKICSLCEYHKLRIKQDFKFDGYDLESVLEEKDFLEISNLVSSVSKENFIKFCIDTIPIGKISLYEVLLQHKKINLDFGEAEWREYLTALKHSLISYYAARKIIQKEKPDAIVAYSPEYSVNHAFCLYGKSINIPFYFLHAGGNLRHFLGTLAIGKNHTLIFFKTIMTHWNSFKDIPVDASILSLISDHFIELFSGTHAWVYSAKKVNGVFDLRARFNINKDQKILVATMSSYDERFSGESIGTVEKNFVPIFPTQIHWVTELIEYLKSHPEFFLIVRVHPREFPNKREGVRSDHSRLLERIFHALPSNVAVNWPDDNISLYDIAGEADVFLNAWSNVGKEMSLLGIPVVIYSQDLIFYPADLNYLGSSKKDYFAKIELALKEGWSFERIRRTYRWYALDHKYSLFDISDRYPESIKRINLVQRGIRKFFRKIVPASDAWFRQMDRKYIEKRKRPISSGKLVHELIIGDKDSVLDILDPESIKRVTEKQETKFLKREMKRLLHTLYSEQEIKSNTSIPLLKNIKAFIES